MKRMVVVSVFLVLFVFSAVAGFAQDRQALIEKINTIKGEYYQQRYDIDNQVRALNKDWHMNQMKIHEEIKANPEKARTLRAELWEGARQLSEKKKSLYSQLTPLRKDWYSKRMAIEAKIADIDAQERAKRD